MLVHVCEEVDVRRGLWVDTSIRQSASQQLEGENAKAVYVVPLCDEAGASCGGREIAEILANVIIIQYLDIAKADTEKRRFGKIAAGTYEVRKDTGWKADDVCQLHEVCAIRVDPDAAGLAGEQGEVFFSQSLEFSTDIEENLPSASPQRMRVCRLPDSTPPDLSQISSATNP
jgi:hypothetical protein